MKAFMLWEPERLELLDLPLRPLRQGEVLLRVAACSICGSDLEGYHGYHPKMATPRVMGHEVASIVAEVGPGVTGLSVGDRVAGTGGVTCGECAACVLVIGFLSAPLALLLAAGLAMAAGS